MPVWFAKVRNALDRSCPVLYHGDKPSQKRADGRRIKFDVGPIEVPDTLAHLLLDELARVPIVDGEFCPEPEGADDA